MSNLDMVGEIKDSVRRYMATYSYSIGDMDDSQAIKRLGAGCTTGMLKIELEHRLGVSIKAENLRNALESLHKKGDLLKASLIGGMNTYWPVGFADELRGES